MRIAERVIRVSDVERQLEFVKIVINIKGGPLREMRRLNMGIVREIAKYL